MAKQFLVALRLASKAALVRKNLARFHQGKVRRSGISAAAGRALSVLPNGRRAAPSASFHWTGSSMTPRGIGSTSPARACATARSKNSRGTRYAHAFFRAVMTEY